MGEKSVFHKSFDRLFATYAARFELRDKVMGGTPKDPKIIQAWLRAKAGLEDAEEIRQALVRTLQELGAEVSPGMTYEELEQASEGLAASRNTNGFKRDANGLYLESRTVKAMLRESVNILYAGELWGKTRKGPRNFFSERVYVNPDNVSLGVDEPSGVELFIGHVNGPKGPQSTLTYHEYVTGPTLEFQVTVLRDEVTERQWEEVWLHAQENGHGALRSQGFGRFDVVRWEKIAGPPAPHIKAKALEAEAAALAAGAIPPEGVKQPAAVGA